MIACENRAANVHSRMVRHELFVDLVRHWRSCQNGLCPIMEGVLRFPAEVVNFVDPEHYGFEITVKIRFEEARRRDALEVMRSNGRDNGFDCGVFADTGTPDEYATVIYLVARSL